MAESPSLNAAPERNIEPVPKSERTLGTFDLTVLWLSLGVGLLVIEAGTFLADLGLRNAIAATLVGSVVGVTLLALVGRIGAVEAVPSMVLLRPVLGIRGTYLPSALNVLQLVGWTAFELWIMGYAASEISYQLLGYRGPAVWILVFAAFSALLALGGPLAVVRKWLERFGVWAMLAATIYLTIRLVWGIDLAALWDPAESPPSFWLMVDLVIAMPVSWLPLVSDYNRFARSPAASFRGTFLGYVVANSWFYLLGVLFILTVGAGQADTAQDLVVAILAVAGGWLALLMILVDETDNAFADIYSAAMSVQNVLPRVSHRALVLLVSTIATVLAVSVTMMDYFEFLLVIGSVFVPLFALLVADYYVVHRGSGYDSRELYEEGGAYWYESGVNVVSISVWLVGVLFYHLIQGTGSLATRLPGIAGAGAGQLEQLAATVGASVPTFVLVVVIYVILHFLRLLPQSADGSDGR